MSRSERHSPRLLALPVLGCLLAACGSSSTAPPGTSGSGGAAGSSGSGGASPSGSGGTTPTGSGGSTATGSGGTTATGSGGSPATGTGGSATDAPVVVDGSNTDGAMPSAGCGAAAAAAPTSGRFMIDVAGTMRDYIIKLPAGYDGHRPYPLIFAFHGAMYNAQSVADGGPPGSGPYYGIESQAAGRAIFVAPQALPGSWSNQSGRDVAYVNAMLARFKTELCVDNSRIFSVGFSAGAIMTLTLACTPGHGFRAIAPMSGSLPGSCTGDQRTAYWSSHGTADPTIPIASGMAARDEFRRRNHCTAMTTVGVPAGCVDYQGCDAGYPVTWCTFTGVHQPAPFAGEAIWTFLSAF